MLFVAFDLYPGNLAVFVVNNGLKLLDCGRRRFQRGSLDAVLVPHIINEVRTSEEAAEEHNKGEQERH